MTRDPCRRYECSRTRAVLRLYHPSQLQDSLLDAGEPLLASTGIDEDLVDPSVTRADHEDGNAGSAQPISGTHRQDSDVWSSYELGSALLWSAIHLWTELK